METETKPVYTWDVQPSRRNLTAADIRLQCAIDDDGKHCRRSGGGGRVRY